MPAEKKEPTPVGAKLCIRTDAVKDHHQEPDTIDRRCTDPCCCILFTVLVLVFGALTAHAVVEGDPSRLAGLSDDQGRLCGVSTAVLDKPYLYFCQDSVGSLERVNRMCVMSCPYPRYELEAYAECPQGASPSYKSTVFAEKICVPEPHGLRRQLYAMLLERWQVGFFLRIAELRLAWGPIAISAILAPLLGILYLHLIREHATTIVVMSLIIVSLWTGAHGAWELLQAAICMSWRFQPHRGECFEEFVGGSVLILVSLTFLGIAATQKKATATAHDCIKSASECIWDMPSVLFEPFLALSIKGPILILLLTGFLYLLSSVEQEEGDDLVAKRAADIAHGGQLDKILHVRLESPRVHCALVAFYVIMAAWIMELCSAMSRFTISYAAEQWFFSHYNEEDKTKGAPPFATCAAWRAAVRYHLGTLAFGAFIIPLVAPFRLGLRCISPLYQATLKYISPTAYLDVAINAFPFCQAAYHSRTIMEHQATNVLALHSATWMVQLAGLAGIASIGSSLTYCLVQVFPIWGTNIFVSEPLFISAFSAFLCWLVALPYMLLFDHVADSILFSFAIQKIRDLTKPARIVELVDRFHWCTARGEKDDQPLPVHAEAISQPPETQALLQKHAGPPRKPKYVRLKETACGGRTPVDEEKKGWFSSSGGGKSSGTGH